MPDPGNGRTPAPTTGRAPGPAERGTIDQLLYGLVRDVRAEAQNIARALVPVQAALDLVDAASRGRELKRTLEHAERVLAENSIVIAERLARIRSVFEEAPRLYDRVGDAVTTLENEWREVQDAVTWGASPDADEVQPPLLRAAAALREIEWQAGLISVPIRVNQHLQTKRIGGQLRFHESFRDEIGDDERRTALLAFLAQHPASFSGVVDVPTGVIYRVATQPWRRAASWIGLGLAATLGGYAVIWLVTAGLDAVGLGASIPGLGPGRAGELLAAYVGMLAGVLIHVVVEALKQAQRRGSGSFLALEDWFLWVHVRETALLVGILVGLGRAGRARIDAVDARQHLVHHRVRGGLQPRQLPGPVHYALRRGGAVGRRRGDRSREGHLTGR